jgi:vesicle coat complex subunit
MPSEREMAAESLGNAQANPALVAELLRSAREDPAPTVRCACVRCLAKMSVNNGAAMATLQALKGDTDPQVRTAAQEALAGACQASPMQPIQRASFTTSTSAR